MQLGIMQPYLFPYLGYWQHINAVDKFVILDDVNFIKRGFINRNHILLNNRASRFTLPLLSASQNKTIAETFIVENKNEKEKLLLKIRSAYKKAPFFKDVYTLLESIMLFDNNNLSIFVTNSISELCVFMGIETKIIPSSKIYVKNNLKGQLRILDIVNKEKAKTYINPIGGLNLYKKDDFIKNGTELKFLKMNEIFYQQFNNEFIPNLSIIDVLMFNSQKNIAQLLDKYRLV